MRQLLLIAIGCLFARSVHGQFRQQTLVTTPLSPVRRVENVVTVLTHDKHAFELAAQLGLVGAPITVVNGASGDATFDLTGAGSVALLGDGRLMTSGLVGSRLLVFGADGRGQTMIGRQGQGPGEFTGGNNVFAVRGDTLLLPDDVNVRINWVVPDGRVVRMKPRGNEMHSSREHIIGRFPNGALAVSRPVP